MWKKIVETCFSLLQENIFIAQMTKTFCSYVKERNKIRKKIESQKCFYVKAKNKKLKKH